LDDPSTKLYMKTYLLALLCSFTLLACSTAKTATDSAGEMAGEAVEATGDAAEAAGETIEGTAEEAAAAVEEANTDMKEAVADAVEAGPVEPLPTPTMGLSPMKIDYSVMISVDQGDFPMDMSAEIKEEGEYLSVSNMMSTPGGDVSDVCLINKDTFASVKRSMAQGPMGIDVAYEGTTVTGVVNGGPTPVDINATIAGPVFCGGAALPFVVSRMPLAADYTAMLPIFDPTTQVRKNMVLKVQGEESVEVPAGTFDAFKVNLAFEDGTAGDISLWISKEDAPQVVKMMQSIPQMNGLMVTELKATM